MKKAFILTTGTCYPSVTDFNLIKTYLKNNGWALSKRIKDAHLIIIYTCAFVKKKEDISLECILRVRKEKNRAAQTIITGCLPVINKAVIKPIPGENMIPAGSLYELDRLLDSKFGIKTIRYIGAPDKLQANRNAEYLLRIGWGCYGKCSYCAVKFVFGKPRSRPPEEIMAEFEHAYSKGYRKFVLIANDTGSYGEGLNISFLEILGRLTARHKDSKFALSHLSPDKLKEVFPRLKKFVSAGKVWRINVPVESGSNKILRLMNRNYTVSDFKSYVQKLISCNKKLVVKTDILLGFPSETNKDFQDSLKLVEWLGRNKVFFQCLAYSSRPGTKANKLPGQIDETTKAMRLKQLNQLCRLSYILRDKELFDKFKEPKNKV